MYVCVLLLLFVLLIILIITTTIIIIIELFSDIKNKFDDGDYPVEKG